MNGIDDLYREMFIAKGGWNEIEMRSLPSNNRVNLRAWGAVAASELKLFTLPYSDL